METVNPLFSKICRGLKFYSASYHYEHRVKVSWLKSGFYHIILTFLPHQLDFYCHINNLSNNSDFSLTISTVHPTVYFLFYSFDKLCHNYSFLSHSFNFKPIV